MARELGVTDEPTTTSTLSSVMSLRMFLTARVVSVPSSSTKYSIFWPSTSLGKSATVLRSGIPREAAGPVLASVRPTLPWAEATRGKARASARARLDGEHDAEGKGGAGSGGIW